ncbi:MAG: hypothetical protein B6I31_02105 [Desulfobacteraceae bacterium 4572_19]|nr:MAG: hypothetical protein B6I31_02105 [Desulfobacteraceae bacterium 4572_19]
MLMKKIILPQLLISHSKIFFFLSALFFVNLCTTHIGYSEEARLKNMTVTNTRDYLICNFSIEGAFTKQIKEGILKGIPTSFSIFINLQLVRSLWFDKEIADIEIIHTIKYNTLKKEFYITLNEKSDEPVIIKDFKEAQKLMESIVNFKVISLKELDKGKEYQLEAKTMLSEVTLPLYLHYILFFVSFWDFETSWHSINFIY